jgi:DNA (cytosine-5)-methyltransferase 3A
MNVLSLFDGIACGRLALEKTLIPVSRYYSSEVDAYPASVARRNWPDIIELGDIRSIRHPLEAEIDIVMGGSPCQGFSRSGYGRQFGDDRSGLFFEFARIVKEFKPRWFLLENVDMKMESRDRISEMLGVKPIKINSALVSAQNRTRLYWTNIDGVTQPEDRQIYLCDIIQDAYTERDKSYCITSSHKDTVTSYFRRARNQIVLSKNEMLHVGNDSHTKFENGHRIYHPIGKSSCVNSCSGGNRAPKTVVPEYWVDSLKDLVKKERSGSIVLDKSQWRALNPVECERLQTIPDNYTAEGIDESGNTVEISKTRRYKMIGNGWTVDVIAHILSFIPIFDDATN